MNGRTAMLGSMDSTLKEPDRTEGDGAADVVLVGAGHAHLQVVAEAHRFRALGLSVAVLDPGDFWYSGMASGLLGGRYAADEDRIDVARFARACGVGHRRARVVGLDKAGRRLRLAGGGTFSYRAVSFNIGSQVAVPFPVEEHDRLWRAKPIYRLATLRNRLREDWRAERKVRFLVVGGGTTGCELACNIRALARQAGGKLDLTLVENGPRLMPGKRPAVSAAMHHFLVKQGVTVHLNSSIAQVTARRARFADGKRLDFDQALLATGLVANSDVVSLGLAANAERGLVVRNELCSVDDRHVFAAGDCADILGHDLPRLGVFGVRAAPIVAANLLSLFTGSDMKLYHPQKIWFSAQNLGDGTGLATWGPFWWQGRAALQIKEFLDRRFMARFQTAIFDGADDMHYVPTKIPQD